MLKYVEEKQSIPKIIHQTYPSKTLSPELVDNIKKIKGSVKGVLNVKVLRLKTIKTSAIKTAR